MIFYKISAAKIIKVFETRIYLQQNITQKLIFIDILIVKRWFPRPILLGGGIRF